MSTPLTQEFCLLLTIPSTEGKAALWQKLSIQKNSFRCPNWRKSSAIVTLKSSVLLRRNALKLGWLLAHGLQRAKNLGNTSRRNANRVGRSKVKNRNSVFSLETGLIRPYYLNRDERVLKHSLTAKSTRIRISEARDLGAILHRLCRRSRTAANRVPPSLALSAWQALHAKSLCGGHDPWHPNEFQEKPERASIRACRFTRTKSNLGSTHCIAQSKERMHWQPPCTNRLALTGVNSNPRLKEPMLVSSRRANGFPHRKAMRNESPMTHRLGMKGGAE